MTDCEHEFHWHLADCNENGWRCWMCGFKPGDEGHSPKLDRELTDCKVSAVLQSLNSADLVYVSNNDMADSVVATATIAIEDAGTFDQWSIILELMRVLCGDHTGHTGHASFWKRRAALMDDANPPKGAA